MAETLAKSRFALTKLAARQLVIGGVAIGLMGVGMLVPLVAVWSSDSVASVVVIALLLLAMLAITVGVLVFLVGTRHRCGDVLPSGVRASILCIDVILAFVALEFSDGLARQGGRLIYWTSLLFLPALVLLVGLTNARRWAWWAARLAFALLVIWFLGFMLIVPFVHVEARGAPVPWYGRAYMMVVSAAFAGVMAGGFRSLGGRDARGYFGLARREEDLSH